MRPQIYEHGLKCVTVRKTKILSAHRLRNTVLNYNISSKIKRTKTSCMSQLANGKLYVMFSTQFSFHTEFATLGFKRHNFTIFKVIFSIQKLINLTKINSILS